MDIAGVAAGAASGDEVEVCWHWVASRAVVVVVVVVVVAYDASALRSHICCLFQLMMHCSR